MMVLLMIYKNIRFAIDMAYVSRIINIERNKPGEELCLWDPAPAAVGIKLKNGLILPASHVEEMLAYEREVTRPNPFLEGIMKNRNIEGFILVKNRIYGVLGAIFLKMAGIKE